MKNIYDKLNDIDMNIDEYEKEDFNDIEKQRIKRSFKKSIKKDINYKKYMIAASVGIVSIGILYNTSIGADAYLAASEIGNNMKQALGIKESLKGYAENVEQSVTKRGLTVRVKEALLDGDELLVYLEHEYDKELKENEDIELISERLYINGKLINNGISGYSTKITKNKKEYVLAYKLDEHTRLNEDLNVKIKIHDAYKWKDKNLDEFDRILGPWTFKFKVNGSNLVKDTKEVKIDKSIKLDNSEKLYVDSYRGNVVNQVITLKIFKDDSITELSDGELLLKGKDDLGNKVTFRSKSGISSYDGLNMLYEYDKSNSMFDMNAKSLKLTPYIKKTVDENGKEITKYKKIGQEFTIDLNSK